MVLGSVSIILVFRGPIRKWWRKVRRRKGGVYLVRVDHHVNRARRVWGYVGESVNFYFRKRQHLGTSRFDPFTGKASATALHKVPVQPWSDLRPRWYYIPLPWWLCWKWILRPLETLFILLLWPRYNDAKNRWNPLRITKPMARIHRMSRDQGTATQVIRVWTAHGVRYALQGAGVLLILAGVAGYVYLK